MSTHDVERQVEAVLDVLAPKIDAGDAVSAEAMPDIGPGWEWYAELADRPWEPGGQIVTAVRTAGGAP